MRDFRACDYHFLGLAAVFFGFRREEQGSACNSLSQQSAPSLKYNVEGRRKETYIMVDAAFVDVKATSHIEALKENTGSG